MKALNVIGTAYRATLEEQDDTIVWLTHAMKGAGAELDVLLKGGAVNYAVRGQEVKPLSFGMRQQAQSPQLAEDVSKLMTKGINVYIVSDDVEARGIASDTLIEGLKPLKKSDVPELMSGYDQVWQW